MSSGKQVSQGRRAAHPASVAACRGGRRTRGFRWALAGLLLPSLALGGVQPVKLGEPVSGAIVEPGGEQVYALTNVAPATRIYIERSAGTNTNQLSWLLQDSFGRTIDSNLSALNDLGPFNLMGGDYTLSVRARTASATGSYTFIAHAVSDTESVLVPGITDTRALSGPGASHVYSIALDQPGELVFFFSGVSPISALHYRLVDAWGNERQPRTANVPAASPVHALPAGTHRLEMLGNAAFAGSFEVRAETLSRVEQALTLDQPRPYLSTSAADRQAFRFSLADVQRVFVDFSVVGGVTTGTWRMERDDGLVLFDWQNSLTEPSEPLVLGPGSYTLSLASKSANPIEGTLALWTVVDSDDVLVAGTGVPGAIVTPGQRHRYAITALSGGVYTLHSEATSNTSGLTWTLLDAEGRAVLATTNTLAPVEDIALLGGDYVVEVDGKGDAVGSFIARLSPRVFVDAAIAVPSTIADTIAEPGQQYRYDFSVPADRLFRLERLSTSNAGGLNIELVDALGRAVLPRSNSLPAVAQLALMGGNYTLTVRGEGDQIGEFSYALIDDGPSPFLAGGTPIALGDEVADTVGVGSPQRFLLDLAAPTRVYIDLLAGASSLRWSLYDPAGESLFASVRAQLTANDDRGPFLLAAGSYTLELTELSAAATDFAFRMVEAPLVQEVIEIEDTVAVVPAAPGYRHEFSFEVLETERLFFDLQAAAGGIFWQVLDAVGQPVFARTAASATSQDRGPLRLAAGSYRVVFDANFDSVAPFGFQLRRSPTASTTLAPASLPLELTDTFAVPGERRDYTLQMPAGVDSLYLRVNQGFSALRYSLRDGDGMVLVEDRTLQLSGTHDAGPLPVVGGATYFLSVYVRDNFQDTGSWSIELREPPSWPDLPIEIGDTLVWSDIDPGDRRSYTFSVGGAPQRVMFDSQSGTVGLRGRLLQSLSGWPVFEGNLWSAGADFGPFVLPPGDYRLEIESTAVISEYRARLNAAPVFDGGTLALNTVTVVEFPEPGAEALFSVAPESNGQPLTFDLMSASTFNRWTLVDPVGTAVFGLVNASSPSVHDQGPLQLKSGTYTLRFDPQGDATATVYFRVSSPMETVEIPEGCAACGALDILFAFDTSGSMGPIGTAVCDLADDLVAAMAADGVPVTARYWGLTNTTLIPCVDTSVLAELGPQLPGTPPDGMTGLNQCSGGGQPEESWSLAAAVAADRYPWVEDAVRLVVPVADEGPYCGDAVNDLDYQSVLYARTFAAGRDTVLSPIVPDYVGDPVVAMAELLAMGTGGVATVADFSEGQLLPTARAIARAACSTQQVAVAPRFAELSPLPGSVLPAGVPLVLGGRVIPVNALRPVLDVRVNGEPAGTLDSTGAFFATVVLAPGPNTVSVTALEACGPTVLELELIGAGAEDDPWAGFAEVSFVTTGAFSGTTFDLANERLLVEVRAHNNGSALRGPLMLVAGPDLHPGLTLLNADGLTPNGEPYVVMVPEGEVLAAGAQSASRALAFANPQRQGIDFTPRWLAPANQPPHFTSIPSTRATLDRPWTYVASAADGNGDTVSFALLSAPPGMSLAGSALSWTPTAVGTFDVVLRASDGRSGFATQAFSISVTDTSFNAPPILTSAPLVQVPVGADYAYPATAVDPDGDALTWSLPVAPTGMTVDADSGLVSWPAAVSGQHSVQLRVTDPAGAAATQTWTLFVGERAGITPAPGFVSTPSGFAAVGVQYRYLVELSDSTAAGIALELVQGPAGMTLDPESGVLGWVPELTDLGPHAVELRVVTADAAQSSQAWTLMVLEALPNQPPYFTTTPPLRAVVDQPWSYAALAIDPEFGPLVYDLTLAPPGMQVDSDSGMLDWTPSPGSPAHSEVSLRATDVAGAVAMQDFALSVRAGNSPPLLLANPPAQVFQGATWNALFSATDGDGDAVEYRLAEGPLGMLVDGEIGWASWPTAGVPLGVYPAEVVADDGWGGEDRWSFAVEVIADTQAPQVDIVPSRQPACLGETLEVCVQASDNVGVVSRDLQISGVTQTLTASCVAWTPPAVGVFPAQASASDPFGLVGSSSVGLQVADCNDEQKPVATLHSPAPESTHDSPVPIVVSIDDNTPAALTWTVTMRRGEDGPIETLAEGSGAVLNAAVATFDPTRLPAGDYRIEVLGSDGVQTGGIAFRLHAGSGAKPGRVYFAINDLSIPVGGIPIAIGRSYDSLEAGPFGGPAGDLGPGWHLTLSATVEDSARDAPPDAALGILLAEGFTLDTRVVVTKPDGRRVGFTFDPEPLSFPQVLQARVRFRADPGVDDVLRAAEGPETVWNFGAGYADFIIPYNPDLYELETPEGVVYLISERDGLLEVRDALGGVLSVSDEGVASSWGPRVDYVRDALGRITDAVLIDDDGVSELGRILYAYDAAGNLVSATDLAGGASTFEYGSAAYPHHLTAMFNALGEPLARHLFDDDGRLLAHCPPDGDTATLEGCSQYSFDAEGGVQTIFDPRGFRSDLFFDARGLLVVRRDWFDSGPDDWVEQQWLYDERGRVLQYTDGDGGLTRSEFDADGNELLRVLPGGESWNFEYGDCAGEWTRQCDGLGNCYRRVFDEQCRMTAAEDPLGGLTQYGYDSRGLRSSVTDPLGQIWSFEHDGRGLLSRVTVPGGGEVTLQYSGLGELTRIENRDGSVREFVHDEGGRLIEERWPGVGTVASWDYNAAGLVTRAENGNSRLDFSYWPTGRVRRVDHAAPGAPSWWVEYDYDGSGNVEQVRDSAGGITDYQHNGINHLVSLRQSGSGVLPKRVDFEVSAGGLPLLLRRYADLDGTLPGPVTEYGFGCASCPGSLQFIEHRNAGGDLIHRLDYSRDAALQIVAMNDADGAHSYVLDGRGWLVESNHPPALGPISGATTWDAAGNWLSRPVEPGPPVLSYAQGQGGHRLLSAGDHVYSYSANGDLESRVHGPSGESLLLGHSRWERVVEAQLADGGGQVLAEASFDFAMNGWRVSAIYDGTPRHFVHDGPNAAVALDAAGSVVWRRLHTRFVDRALAEERDGQLRWLLADHIGSVRDVVDHAGQLLARYSYDPFGRQLVGPAPTPDDALRFSGREFDLPGGLGFYRARIYDPALGRFVSEDPLEPWHYRYAENNPLIYADPSGETAAIEYAMILCSVSATVVGVLPIGRFVDAALTEAANGLQGLPASSERALAPIQPNWYDPLKGFVPCGAVDVGKEIGGAAGGGG